MRFSFLNRVLLPGVLAGSAVLAGTACSRPDRTESGSNTSSTVLEDSNSRTTTQPPVADTATGTTTDTAAIPADSGRSVAPNTPAKSSSPRVETAAPSESEAAGYRPMDRDTGNIPEQHADSARVTTDTAQAADTEPSSDSSVAVSVSSDTTDNGGRIRPPEDSTEILGQVTTDSTAAAVETTDSTEVVRVRPPEDSTEILGNVTSSDDIANETADEQVVNPDDQEKVATSETASEAPNDEVGAAAVASGVTGAEAVALVTRGGMQCAAVDAESNEAVRWDMSSTPVALNPCGLGSMNLSKIWTRVE